MRIVPRKQRARVEPQAVVGDARKHRRLTGPQPPGKLVHRHRGVYDRDGVGGKENGRCAPASRLRGCLGAHGCDSRDRVKIPRQVLCPLLKALGISEHHRTRRDLVPATFEIELERALESRDSHLVQAKRSVERVLAQAIDRRMPSDEESSLWTTEELVAGEGHDINAGHDRLTHQRLAVQQPRKRPRILGVQQSGAEVEGRGDAEFLSEGGQLVRPDLLGEAHDFVIGRVGLEQEPRIRAGGAVVRGARSVRGSDGRELDARALHYIRQSEGPTDFHQLAAADDDALTGCKGRKRQDDRGRIVVHGDSRLGTGQAAEQDRDSIVPAVALSRSTIDLEHGIGSGDLFHRRRSLRMNRRTTQTGMEHHSGGVHDADQPAAFLASHPRGQRSQQRAALEPLFEPRCIQPTRAHFVAPKVERLLHKTRHHLATDAVYKARDVLVEQHLVYRRQQAERVGRVLRHVQSVAPPAGSYHHLFVRMLALEPPMSLRWRTRETDPETVASVARNAGVPDLVARMLVARGHTDGKEAARHLQASAMGLHDPFLLPGMQAGTARLARAIRDGETILVHGDYDVDGVTGTSLLMRLLRLVGAKAAWHIPNRLTDGYSFGAHSIARAEETNAKVVISVDNGTSAHEIIAQLAERGVDTVVTDHHEASPGPLPVATAIVNPKLPGSTYPWRELCGGAVAFKLAWGLAQELTGAKQVTPELKAFLQDAMAYVAIATVCDVVPLIDENRVFARAGLRALEISADPGLRAMLRVCGLQGRRLSADDVGFQVGPRINASGRLGSAQRAVDLLLAEDEATARRLADELDGLNQQRKEIETEVLVEARIQAADFADAEANPVLVVAGEGWHQGVVGIVASRLVEEFGRPAIVIGFDGTIGRGSARTVNGFSVLEAMRGGAEHMERFGGHAQAAGCEIQPEKVDDLRAAVCARAREMLGTQGGFKESELMIDAELPFDRVNRELMSWVDRLEPFGEGNAEPLFASDDLRLAEPARVVGRDGRHLLLRLRKGDHVLKGMAFGQADQAGPLQLGVPVRAAFTPRWNTFRGETNLELVIKDFRCG